MAKFIFWMALVLSVIIIFTVCASCVIMFRGYLLAFALPDILVQSDYQKAVSDQIEQTAQNLPNDAQLAFSSLLPFEWDRVCMFRVGADFEYVNEVLGFRWKTGPGYVQEDYQVFVFVKDETVVQKLVFNHKFFVAHNWYDVVQGTCMNYKDEVVLTVTSYVRADRRIVQLVLPDWEQSTIK